MDHVARSVQYNHSVPSHHYLNAINVYKSVKNGNTRKNADSIIMDSNAPEIRDKITQFGKNSKSEMVTGMKLQQKEEQTRDNSLKTVNYKQLFANSKHRKNDISGENFASMSKNTQNRALNHDNYRNPNIYDQDANMKYHNFDTKERLTGGLGNKYMTRHMQRDESQREAFDS
jgi:hypothetical protein